MYVLEDQEITKLIEQFEELVMKVDSLLAKGGDSSTIFTVDETCDLLHVSKRTLQKYRDEGMISFSQVADKIFFQQEDVQNFLDQHRVEAFNPKKGRYVC